MNIVCFGLSHQTAEVDVRERFAFADKELPAALRRLHALDGVREALILSTCNRVEHYAVIDGGPGPAAARTTSSGATARPKAARTRPRTSFSTTTRPAAWNTSSAWRAGWNPWSSARPKSSARSSAPTCWRRARARPRACSTSSFQRAFQVAKQVRSRTSIGRGSGVGGHGGGRSGGKTLRRPAPLPGARARRGRNGRTHGAQPPVARRAAGGLRVANRSPERAAALAADLGGRAVPDFAAWEREAATWTSSSRPPPRRGSW